ncbi:HhH-GPD domain-containing protein, variant [Blastomyces dermatitidis ER-3]|uniref:HhH-GPD domain-containing protein n=1 Tax=Ajellomyces dermatitidis (strain ER-3 / ATCC MYA-2586) TaxID=559297 RepID=A0ABX2VZN6_AJEDR|nr:HhH-GPD domain-containing protein [Blastomyces dermatitidis ER-3]XP_045282336.1 HhH-GPD domain-containing protein, variant [Blastomyces dermatitidis ER-3]EEQ84579.1 HhH-GPD domain-containing protein [Blastomyces dermatitidis ER-3]OAT02609.1 HhH-GPD domain-containing protein, variant [Blastomyces dermatitidis ER-3]
MVKNPTQRRASPAKGRHDAHLADQNMGSTVRRSSRLQSLQQDRASEQPSQAILSHPPIFTIGHGTRTLPELIGLLQSIHVTKLVDVRSIPRSFTNPQFNHDTLQDSAELNNAHITYLWSGPLLGGRRNAKQPNLDQHNTIRVAAFRNYAGYMCTSSFKEGLTELKSLAENLQISGQGCLAIMCSETLWWRCHRRMIADILVTHGWKVQHLGVGKKPMEHERWEIARVGEEGNLVYDGHDSRSKRKACLT